MQKTGILKAMLTCLAYQKMTAPNKARIREERLQEIVAFARRRSRFFQTIYEKTGDNPLLVDLPPTNKADLMRHFDEWVTDPAITQAEIDEFLKDDDNIGRRFKGEYLVFTTSGSTGNPLVTVCNKTAKNIMDSVSALRVFARKQDFRAFLKKKRKTIGVFATGGFYLGNSSIRARLLSKPRKKEQIAITSALYPLSKIVGDLNAFQPAMLGGYPTILELLIDEQKSGRLHIDPVVILTGGEHLSEELRQNLADTFACYVQTSYSCTEGGTIACECTERHFHVNEDWVIIEPVDADNQPVPDGVQSDKILLTNLFNYTQPFLRYEITDRVVMHHEPCPCGNPFPWLTLEGRTDDIVILQKEGKTIKIAPLAIYATLKQIHEIQRFQVVVQSGNRIDLRLIVVAGHEKKEVFDTARIALTSFFGLHGVTDTVISLSTEEPKPHPKSGKFKLIINE